MKRLAVLLFAAGCGGSIAADPSPAEHAGCVAATPAVDPSGPGDYYSNASGELLQCPSHTAFVCADRNTASWCCGVKCGEIRW
jgi:hypothetical protein